MGQCYVPVKRKHAQAYGEAVENEANSVKDGGKQKAKGGKLPSVDEGRKRTLAIVTAILIAPKLKDYHWDGGTRAPACESWLAAEVSLGERIPRMIDTKSLPNKTVARLTPLG